MNITILDEAKKCGYDVFIPILEKHIADGIKIEKVRSSDGFVYFRVGELNFERFMKTALTLTT